MNSYEGMSQVQVKIKSQREEYIAGKNSLPVTLCVKTKNRTKPHRVTCLNHQTLARITQGSDTRNSSMDQALRSCYRQPSRQWRGRDSPGSHTKLQQDHQFTADRGIPVNPDLNGCKVHALSNPPIIHQNC